MKKYWCIGIILFIMVSTIPVSAENSAEYTKPIRILVPVTAGLRGGSFSKLMIDVIAVMAQETGYKFEYEEATFRTGDDDAAVAYEAFKAGKADISYLRSIELVDREKEWDGMFKPGFVMIFNANNRQEECFYVLEDSGINKIEDLRGKTWGGSKAVPALLLLHENGIDESLSKFFGKTVFIDDAPPSNSIFALQQGIVDCVTVNKHHLAIGSAGIDDPALENKSSARYKTIACTPGELNWIFVFHKDLPDEVVEKIAAIFVTAHKAKAFQKFKFIFLAIKGGFARIKDKDYARTREIAKLMNTLGWKKEQAALLKKRAN